MLSFVGRFFTTLLFFFSSFTIFIFSTLILSVSARIINATYAPFLIFISFHYLIGFFSNITSALFSSSII